jgi:hypothetical protein
MANPQFLVNNRLTLSSNADVTTWYAKEKGKEHGGLNDGSTASSVRENNRLTIP